MKIDATLPEGLWLLSDRHLPAMLRNARRAGLAIGQKRKAHSVNPARNASQREAGGSVSLVTLSPELVEGSKGSGW
jgi:hypothetical protein